MLPAPLKTAQVWVEWGHRLRRSSFDVSVCVYVGKQDRVCHQWYSRMDEADKPRYVIEDAEKMMGADGL